MAENLNKKDIANIDAKIKADMKWMKEEKAKETKRKLIKQNSNKPLTGTSSILSPVKAKAMPKLKHARKAQKAYIEKNSIKKKKKYEDSEMYKNEIDIGIFNLSEKNYPQAHSFFKSATNYRKPNKAIIKMIKDLERKKSVKDYNSKD